MSFTLHTSGAAVYKAGAFASTDITASGAALKAISDWAEQKFCARTRKDWITDYANIPTNMKEAISDAVSTIAAKKIIAYDTTGWFSKIEAQLALDILDDEEKEYISQFSNKENQKFN